MLAFLILSITSNPYKDFTEHERIDCQNCGTSAFNIINNIFIDISIRDAEGIGGAILILQACEFQMNQCHFDNCRAETSGGAGYICQSVRDYHVYAMDVPIQISNIDYCCFQDCYCYANTRSDVVLDVSAENNSLSYLNTVRCPGHNPDLGRGQMNAGQISLVGTYFYFQNSNLTHGYAKYSCGLDILDTELSESFTSGVANTVKFCYFSEMAGSFVVYFQYLWGCHASYLIFKNNTVIDIGDSGIYPGLIFSGVGGQILDNSYFIQTIFTNRGRVVVYDANYYRFYSVTLNNCYVDADRYETARMTTNNCHFNAGPITAPSHSRSNCWYEIPTGNFTESIRFSLSKLFSLSAQFTSSHLFSMSLPFSSTESFTSSDVFTPSDVFTESSPFTDVVTPVATRTEVPNYVYQGETYSLSHTYIQSLTKIQSCVFVSTQDAFTDENGNIFYSYIQVCSFTQYVIYLKVLAPTFVPSSFEIDTRTNQKGISPEQLIGLVSGVAGALLIVFLIVYTIYIKCTNPKYQSTSDVFTSEDFRSDDQFDHTKANDNEIINPLFENDAKDDPFAEDFHLN